MDTRKNRKWLILITVGILACNVIGCGTSGVGSEHTGTTQGTESVIETESEFHIEILDAEDILLKTWTAYKSEERFEIMGGHFSSALIGLPAKYDLEQSVDLVQMYCFPEKYLSVVDDVATMVDLFNAARFSVSVYHVTDVETMQSVAEDTKTQVRENEWHGEKPEKLFIINIDDQYVVSVYGREQLVNEFKQKLESVYKKMTEVMVEEKLF